MSKLAVAFALLVSVSACKKKGASADEDTIPKDTSSKVDRSSDRAAHDPDAGTGTVKVNDDDGSAPSFGAIYFEFDSTSLDPEARKALQAIADWMVAHPKASITLEGHADARGTDEYNLALGQRRAQVMQDYLARLGVAKARLDTISYGEERPASDGDDEGAYAQNRRGVTVPR